MSNTGLLQETAEKSLKTELLQYPPVFKQALYKLSWTKAPETLLTTAEKMKLAMKVSSKSLADMEEKYWQAWSKLQREHALD
ncbi:MAG: hypothetical protein OXU45_06065 [Candidatus Melainabacteria bacterium]|nr:hypothetical protein [Candidatus Melainabacteria bacterium]